MIIIWQGLGFLVPLITIAAYALANWIVDTYIAYEYSKSHSWPTGIAFLVAGALCWYIGNWFHQQGGREVIDRETGEVIDIEKPDTFFFIPMRYCGIILGILGVFSLF